MDDTRLRNGVRAGLLRQGLAGRVMDYLEAHPEVAPETFMADAVGHELDRRERAEAVRPQPTATDEVEAHARLCERLAAIHRRRSVWSGAMDLFGGAFHS